MDWLRSQLICAGWQTAHEPQKVWKRNNQTVVICLVDDVMTCTDNADDRAPFWFDQHTVVITDNVISVPTMYRVCRMPSSWLGIYFYQSEPRVWQPDRRFGFCVNRIDAKRLMLFLEYRKKLPWSAGRDSMDYVNINCWRWNGDNTSPQGLAENFERTYSELSQPVRDIHQITKDTDIPTMPWRNHDLDLESCMHRVWLNVVVETYSGDSVIAVSEKTFRALVTPVPWVLYSGKNTVVYLESLGFDCLKDIVDHGYDDQTESEGSESGDKLSDWWWRADQNRKRLQSLNFAQLQSRCLAAAKHNRYLLESMRRNWPKDMCEWSANCLQFIH